MTAERPPASRDRLAALVTSGRFPPATALVRAFTQIGARVDVADSYPLSPALHSHRADQAHAIAPPASQPLRFVDDVARSSAPGRSTWSPELRGDLLPGPYGDRVPAPIFTSPFATVAELHDKALRGALRPIGLPTPATSVVRTREELAAAAGRLDAFVARPAFSRGGLVYLTTTAPVQARAASKTAGPRPTTRGWSRNSRG